jgi:hypothetical protein
MADEMADASDGSRRFEKIRANRYPRLQPARHGLYYDYLLEMYSISCSEKWYEHVRTKKIIY